LPFPQPRFPPQRPAESGKPPSTVGCPPAHSPIADRDLYAATKRRLAQQDWPTMDHYADAKSDVILQILSRTNS
jgi:hypothetical protein